MIPRFPVYLFDVDGTLLDSAVDICGAVQQVIDWNGGGTQDFEYLKSYIGHHLVDLFQEVFPACDAARIDALVEQYRTFYRARGHKLTKVYPGALEGLAALAGRKSTATTKGTPTTRAVLEQFGLLPYFHHVQGTDGFPAKPEPNVILASLEVFGVKPQDCLFIGDSPTDMEAGRRAGVKTCAVLWGYGRRAELARWEPDYWVEQPSELRV